MQALVSIIVPAYNSALYLTDCLQSVTTQTYTQWECIIIDDGSSDNTREIVTPFLKDTRFVYCYQSNGGLSAARNKGLELAKGNFIQMLDADDKIFPDKLAKQVHQLKDCNGPCISISDFSYSDPDKKKFNRFLTTHYLKEFILRVSIPHMCFLFSRSCFENTKLRYDVSLHTHEDWDLMLKLLQQNPEIKTCPEPLAWYRVHVNSMTQTRNMRHGLTYIINTHLTDFTPGSDEYALLKIRRKLNKLHSLSVRFPLTVLHSLLLRYAAWKYL